MNKQTAKQLVDSGKVTLGLLRKALRETSSSSWEKSNVNAGLTRVEVLDILEKVIAADDREDGYVMKSSREMLIAINVLREIDPQALL